MRFRLPSNYASLISNFTISSIVNCKYCQSSLLPEGSMGKPGQISGHSRAGPPVCLSRPKRGCSWRRWRCASLHRSLPCHPILWSALLGNDIQITILWILMRHTAVTFTAKSNQEMCAGWRGNFCRWSCNEEETSPWSRDEVDFCELLPPTQDPGLEVQIALEN